MTRNLSSGRSQLSPSLRVMLENQLTNGGRRWRLSAGFLVQATVLVAALLVSLLFSDSLDVSPPSTEGPSIFWVAPPPKGTPEGDPGSSGGGGTAASQIIRRSGPPQLTLDTGIRVSYQPNAEGDQGPSLVGPPGPTVRGIPTGEPIGGSWSPVGPLPQPPFPTQPVPVGGRVQAPKLVRKVEPGYPLPAKAARIEGEVVLQALLDTDGRVRELKVISGHPLLVPAARQAVQHWVYEPTYLNEQPIAVLMRVVVQFKLRD